MSLKMKSPVWEMFQKMILLEAEKDCKGARLQRCYDCKGVARLASLTIAKVLPVWQRCGIRVCVLT